MFKLARTFDLFEPIRQRIKEGMPVFGTCAGMIMLADRIEDGTADQETLGGLDITVRRNAFGRQVDSFEGDLDFAGLDDPVHAVFIRAPWVEERRTRGRGARPRRRGGPAAGRIVAVRQGSLMATSFHPEVGGDGRIHRLFVDLVDDPSARRSDRRGTHVRPLQMGDHQAQEGRRRRPPRQDVRQADQEHRGRGPDGRR